VVAVGGINVLLLIVVAQFLDPNRLLFALIGAAAVFYVVCGPIVFLGPLLPFRQAMLNEKNRLMLRVGAALRVHYQECLEKIGKGGISKEDDEKEERLERMMRMARKMPVWPFDTTTFRKFLTAYIIPLATMMGSPLINDVIKILMK